MVGKTRTGYEDVKQTDCRVNALSLCTLSSHSVAVTCDDEKKETKRSIGKKYVSASK